MSNQSGTIKMEPDISGTNIPDNSRNLDINADYHEPEDLDIHYNKALDRDIKLMEAYRQMPILYDRDHPDFRYVNKKEKAWKELSKKTSMSLENCRKRVTYIRARFTVERRMIRNGQLSSDWPLMDKLKFLHKHVQIRRLRGNDDAEQDGDFEEDPQTNACSSLPSFYNNGSGNHAPHSNKRQSDEDEDSAPAQQRVKRRHSIEDLDPMTPLTPFRHQSSMYMPIPEVKTPDICVNGGTFPKRDEHCIFGEYVAEVLKKLPRNVQPQTTLKIMQVLVDVQEANMANDSSHHQHHTSSTDQQQQTNNHNQ